LAKSDQVRPVYAEAVEQEMNRSDQDPVGKFLSLPALRYDEDDEVVSQDGQVPPPHVKKKFRQRFRQFMFEKKPSGYSAISPRKPDGTRSTILFFNGNGRGR
jgi:hypothetical protein